ncbi:MAG: non-canonical purine NTP pyrophosphatase, partial [Patescibacteria group bacterium]
MKDYNHKKIEPKWQKYWESKKLNQAKENSKKKKFYGLIEFPFLSGEGLHVGHIRSNTAMDIISRKRRAEGYEVLYPIGYDAFGLPIENFAIKTGKAPASIVKNLSSVFERQLRSLGFSFDWSKQVNTSDPAYYKWTQWIFLKFLEKGLAYKKKMAINWCPKDKIGLANEEVVDGCCERCGTAVEKREKEQWMLAITKYADRLDRDLDAKKILIGTRNPAKVKMMKACLAGVSGIELLSLDDIPAVDDSALHEGDDFLANAKMKAEFYFKKTGIPTIATDHILWIEKWPENKGFMVHVRKHANPDSPRATDDELIAFLKKFLKTVGGSSRANFHYGFAYADDAGTIVADEVPGNYILQDKEQAKKYWPGYPTEALLKDAETGVFKADQPDDVRYKKIITFLQEKFVVRMLKGAGGVDYLERIKTQQKNWIGRSEGAEIEFRITNHESRIKVFTTRPDTLFGATYLVLAPEHPLIREIENKITNKEEILRYIVVSKKKGEVERTALDKEKTGVELKGVKALNPANQEEIPIFVADYVLGDYGTGAIMAVPAHDERDFEFAKKFNLPIRQVISPLFVDPTNPPQSGFREVVRETVIVFLRNKKDNTYALLDWHGSLSGITTTVMGGVEAGQTPEMAAQKEIQEETGILNAYLVRKMPWVTDAKYCASHKKENRHAKATTLFYEVDNLDSQGKIEEREQKIHTLVWVPQAQVREKLVPVHQKFHWDQL